MLMLQNRERMGSNLIMKSTGQMHCSNALAYVIIILISHKNGLALQFSLNAPVMFFCSQKIENGAD